MAAENATLVAVVGTVVVLGAEVVLVLVAVLLLAGVLLLVLVGAVVVLVLVVLGVVVVEPLLGVVAALVEGVVVAVVLPEELVDDAPLVAASLESPHAESKPIKASAETQQRARVILITILTRLVFLLEATF